MEKMELRLNETLKKFVGQPISNNILRDIKHMVDCEIHKSVVENNLIDFPEFFIPTDEKRFIGNACISISPKNLYSAIWAFGKELPPPKSVLANARQWVSDVTGIKYFIDGDTFVFSMQLPKLMTIEQIISLEPDLKSSIRKYKAIGKTGLVNGRPCSTERLSIEIAETVKCYCSWSKHEILQSDETKEFLTGYLLDLCPNITREMTVKSNG